MFADKGERTDAADAAIRIHSFWLLVNVVYGECCSPNRGVCSEDILEQSRKATKV